MLQLPKGPKALIQSVPALAAEPVATRSDTATSTIATVLATRRMILYRDPMQMVGVASHASSAAGTINGSREPVPSSGM